jgi:hypothetical protein
VKLVRTGVLSCAPQPSPPLPAPPQCAERAFRRREVSNGLQVVAEVIAVHTFDGIRLATTNNTDYWRGLLDQVAIERGELAR